MAEIAAPQGQAAGRPMRPPLPAWPLKVVETITYTPRMKRIVFQGETLDAFEWAPAQDVVLRMTDESGEPVRRHYTVRDHDPANRLLTIDFVLHGHGLAADWARNAKAGDEITVAGPRGRTVLNFDADWHLFTGDETCIPGVFAMLERLPAGAKAFAFLEIQDAGEEQPLHADADVKLTWIHRNGPPEPSSPRLISAFETFEPPPGRGHAYVIGETSTVQIQRRGLIASGWDKSQISAEGYWRPGRLGGHDHVRDD